MKTNSLLNSVTLIVCLICSLATVTNVVAQKKGSTRLKMYYEKLANNDKKISIILNKGKGLDITGVENAEIILQTIDKEDKLKLTSLKTNSNGETALIIEANYVFPIDEEGFSIIEAKYNGNDSLKSAKKQIKFIDLSLEVSLDVVDSVKQVTVYAFEKDSIGTLKPIEGIKLSIGVKRLFSTLYLNQIETNSKGIGTMEFPNDIAGDSIGNITLIIKINDHNDYGTITKSVIKKWGTIIDYNTTTSERSLFGDEAPMWMIISVIIILSGAWYHFIIAIFKVLKIKKLELKA